ncbi:hypothetical protein MY10362_000781 [Beauveria mimosiformis]
MVKRVYFVALGGTVQGTYERHNRHRVVINRLQLYRSRLPLLYTTKGTGVRPHRLVPQHSRQQGKRWAPLTRTLFFHRMLTRSVQVEGEVQGEETSVDKLLKDVGQGPSGATVVRLTQETRDVIADEAGFAVRH